MLYLTGHSSLPQVRLPRSGRSDLVFRGLALARTGGTSQGSEESVIYETSVGKFILSMSSDHGRPPILVLSFSSLEDMGDYLALEHPGLGCLVDDASQRAGLLRPGLAGNWAEEPSRMSSHPAGRFGTPA